MNFFEKQKKTKSKYKLYKDEVKKETLRMQIVLWKVISIITSVSCGIFLYREVIQGKTIINPYIISCIGLLIYSCIMLLLFNSKIEFIKKNIIYIAYINVAMIILTVEGQYMFVTESISYTLYVCIIFMTAILTFGPPVRFFAVVTLDLAGDAIYVGTMYYNFSLIHMMPYIFDIIITIITVTAVNEYVYTTKMNEIENRIMLETERDTDGLSKLLTRKAATTIINNYDGALETCAMLIMDIDDFKTINDNYGHMAGDEVIKEVAFILKHTFRKGDCISRLGGDEFLVFMGDVTKDNAIKRAEELKTNLEKMDFSRVGDIKVSLSVGVSVMQNLAIGDDNFAAMYKIADEKLYEAKAKGKNTYCI